MKRKDIVKKYIDENPPEVSPEVKRLIDLALADLHIGTACFDDEDNTDYPGFVTSCKRIRSEMEEVFPSSVIVDDDGIVTPETYECYHCEEAKVGDECPVCDGSGFLREHGLTCLERKTIVHSYLGTLAEYL